MKILSAAQTREADAYTIQHEQIKSVDLMERAARAFCAWFENKFTPERPVLVVCGRGNNGGDGLAAARMLHQAGYEVAVFVAGEADSASEDFEVNEQRLKEILTVQYAENSADFPENSSKTVLVDALFGTGLNRPVSGSYAGIIEKINASPATVVAIDMPSGLFSDEPTPAAGAIVKAAFTVSFELPKLAFFLPQHEQYVGQWCVVPIGLSKAFLSDVSTSYYCLTMQQVLKLWKPRPRFAHKGTFGHALLLAGSYGKMGAAVLATRACLRSGAGLVTSHIPSKGYDIMQMAAPEAMASADKNRKHLSELPDVEKYNVVGLGPGLGQERATRTAVGQLLATCRKPLVIDADALNIVAMSEKLLETLPEHSILTPHPKEFERLAGPAQDDFHRLELLRNFCSRYRCYVVLKGRHTCIGTPDGTLYFNTTGNPGMATGGTGDVLTGILTALVAQQYPPLEACLLGVYIHGLAGDLAATEQGETALIASDVIEHLRAAFQQIQARAEQENC